MIERDGKKYKLFPVETEPERVFGFPDDVPGCTGCCFINTSKCPTKDKDGEDCCTGTMDKWGIYKEVTEDESERP